MARVERGNPIMSEGNEYRFYKSNLPAVIWDPNKNKPLVEFENGTCITKSKKIAQKLIDLGYPQISPLATQPPDVILGLPGKSIDTSPSSTDDVRVTGENKEPRPITPVKVVDQGEE